MTEFKNYHPTINFIYFFAVIGLSMFLMHPVCLVISLISSCACSVLANGRRAVYLGLVGILPLMTVTALLNSLFNHQGITILTYLPDGNPLTLESIAYGIAASSMLGAVLYWFSFYNCIMTDDKTVYLFGKIIPSLSLVVSMIFGFIPNFKHQFTLVVKAQRGLNVDISRGNFFVRIKNAITIMSVLVTWMLESSVETALSMKCRGYGTGKRSSFSLYSFSRRDFKALCFLVIATGYVLFGHSLEVTYFSYFPVMLSIETNVFSASVMTVYFMLCIMPCYIEIKERIKWNVIKSKT